MMTRSLLLLMFAMAFAGCSDDDNDKTIPLVTPDATGTFTDTRDNNQYEWVRYGGLDWMSNNLRYFSATGNSSVYELEARFEGEENEVNRLLPEYGYLYDFEAAETACPQGWRLPSDDDWKSLEKVLGMQEPELSARGTRGDYQGYLMQEGSGLNMRAGGFYSKYTVAFVANYRFFGVYGYYWTSTADTDGFYFFRKIEYSSDRVNRESTMVSNRLSIRCVRDAR